LNLRAEGRQKEYYPCKPGYKHYWNKTNPDRQAHTCYHCKKTRAEMRLPDLPPPKPPEPELSEQASELFGKLTDEAITNVAPYKIHTRNCNGYPEQKLLVESTHKRKMVRAGRRAGKTVSAAIISVHAFAKGRRILYATPTGDQLTRWWKEVCRALAELINAGKIYKNETEHLIEFVGTENRLRGKTAWNSATLRGDYCDTLILDEYQLMDETAWTEVGQPMLIDKNGDAVLIYTPPSLA